jgi:hypothetical protein
MTALRYIIAELIVKYVDDFLSLRLVHNLSGEERFPDRIGSSPARRNDRACGLKK